ncbi:hypothetical protein QYE76_025842 [Lolium multiflorum]|uniref:Uncharacterized protein n=1 Tax=Lolium multiflorum TaxID=4521 RepID=A0AAD8RF65_LOLMU|nr:hypothetical protein QYE76_025842 [Lolium multiflorum]
MRSIHGALLLAVVLLSLSSEIMSAREVPADGGPFPPEKTCTKLIDVGRRCNADRCSDHCDKAVQAVNSQCGAAGCTCLYYC